MDLKFGMNVKHYAENNSRDLEEEMSHLEKMVPRGHTDDQHSERRHVCNICGAAFILPHHLVRHNMVHTGVRPYRCETCHKQFTRKAGLAQHEFVHTGIRPFVCEVPTCGKQFTDRSTLRRHLLTHSREKPFLCKECEKTFRTKSACRKHYLRHFKGQQSFKCGICEEMFTSADALEKHSTIHEEKHKLGSTSYRCGFCLRVFISQSDLDAHVPLHQTGLKHTCNQCGAKFYTESDLASHMEKHNNNVNNGGGDPTQQTQALYGNPGDQKPTMDDNNACGLSMLNDKCGVDNLNLPTKTESLNLPNGNGNGNSNGVSCSKVVVVLQLPTSASTCMKSTPGDFELNNLQQLLGNAQIDKLLVTTDPVTDSSPSTLAVELSQDQQEGIQQILQNTSVNSVNYMRTENDMNTGGGGGIPNMSQCSLQDTINSMNSNNNVPPPPADLTTLHSPYSMKLPGHHPGGNEEMHNHQKHSNCFIVPNYDHQNNGHPPHHGGDPMSQFPSHDDYKGMMQRQDHLNLRKLGGESVFLSNKNMLQQVLMSSDEMKHDMNHHTHALNHNGVHNSIPSFENHPINNDAVFSIGESITGIDVNSIVRSAVARKLPGSCMKRDNQQALKTFSADELFKMV